MDGQRITRPVWLSKDAADAAAFETDIAAPARAEDWSLAKAAPKGILIYDGAEVARREDDPEGRAEIMAEWALAMAEGPGVVVIEGAVSRDAVARATEVFEGLIEAERAEGKGGGDHFAKPGANDRVWNAAQKHCLADPANFAAYYGAPAIPMASEAWCGPGFQLTAQVNRVNPGGAAQTPHRDYHLGFMPPEEAARFPAHAHRLSPFLTLQGGIAHCDMDEAMGPTMLLPGSQRLEEGYLAFAREDFRDVFARRHVQLPMAMGDAVFFSPALFHGAGTNRSERPRMVNLLQVSSPMGRAIEAVDRDAMVRALYPVLMGMKDRAAALRALACAAEGYAFPTNLDTDPPVGGLAPAAPLRIATDALGRGDAPADLARRLSEAAARRAP